MVFSQQRVRQRGRGFDANRGQVSGRIGKQSPIRQTMVACKGDDWNGEKRRGEHEGQEGISSRCDTENVDNACNTALVTSAIGLVFLVGINSIVQMGKVRAPEISLGCVGRRFYGVRDCGKNHKRSGA